jgi:predicted RNA polymerase sigma factor
MEIAPSPVVALNRANAVAQLSEPQSGLEAIDAVRLYQSVSGGWYECFSCIKYDLPKLEVIGWN